MRTEIYPSDVTDAQWGLIEPRLPRSFGGRPRKTHLRDVVNAIFYILRTGCQWRYLPKDFPPKSTVWRYFDQWRHDGTLETIHDLLRTQVRTQEKPYQPRTTASVDSQSVDTTSGGEHRGRDNAKNVEGRKRHIIVDSMGLLLAVLVTAASVDDAKAAAAWLGKCRRLSKDREKSVLSAEAFVKWAMIHLMLNRLEPKGDNADFHYRQAA
jgi:putative transposase